MVNGCLWFTPAPPHRQSLPSVYGKRLPLVYPCSPPQTKPTICVWQTAASGLLLLPPTDKAYHLCMVNGCLWFTPAPPHRQSLPSVYGKRLPLVYSCSPPTDKAYHLCMVNGCLWFTPAPPHRQSLPSVYGKRLPLVYSCSPPPHRQSLPSVYGKRLPLGYSCSPPPPTDKAYHLCMANGCLWFTPAPPTDKANHLCMVNGCLWFTPALPHRQSLPSVYGKRLPLVYSCSPPQTKPTICVWQTAASGLPLLPPTDKAYHLCMANGCLWFTPAPPHRQSLPSVYGKRLPLVYSCSPPQTKPTICVW